MEFLENLWVYMQKKERSFKRQELFLEIDFGVIFLGQVDLYCLYFDFFYCQIFYVFFILMFGIF